MVISNKPLRFIIAILIACLPLMGFANAPSENTTTPTETTAVAHEEESKTVENPQEIKEKISEVAIPNFHY